MRRKLLTNVGPGQQVPLLVLERAQVLGADLRRRLDLGDVDPGAHARLAQRCHRSPACGAKAIAAGADSRRLRIGREPRRLAPSAAPRRRSPRQRGEDARQVGLGDQHLARLGALVAGDHAAALEHVDQPPGARVAEAQAALEHRGRGGPHLARRARIASLEQRVLVGVEARRRRRRSAVLGLDLLEQLLAQLRLALLAPERRSARRSAPRRCRRPGCAAACEVPTGREQHVALAEQRLGAVLVEDHARVGLRGDRERDPRRDVGLDHAGDHVHARALRREHEVDADRARLLREADDRVLDVGRRDHHQVGELVDHAEDVGQRRLAAPGARSVELEQRRACAPAT